MSKVTIGLLLLLVVSVPAVGKDDENNSKRAVPTVEQMRWQDLEMGAMICFGLERAGTFQRTSALFKISF